MAKKIKVPEVEKVPEFKGLSAVSVKGFNGVFVPMSSTISVSRNYITLYRSKIDGTVDYESGTLGYIEKRQEGEAKKETLVYKNLANDELSDIVFYLP